jgi:hypothetical protein
MPDDERHRRKEARAERERMLGQCQNRGDTWFEAVLTIEALSSFSIASSAALCREAAA